MIHDFEPLVIALSGGKPAVKDCNAFAETAAKAAFGLGDKGDFRNQHKNRHPCFDHFGCQVHVDFGFAAAGNSRQKIGCIFFSNGSPDSCDHMLLSLGQLRRMIRTDGLSERVAVDLFRCDGNLTAVL